MITDLDLEKLAKMLQQAGKEEYTGNIQINFFKGSVSNVVMQQSWKLEDLK